MRREAFQLVVATPLPEAEPLPIIDLNDRVQSITFSTQDPVGFDELRVGLARPGVPVLQTRLPDPVDGGHKYHLQLLYGGHVLWEGEQLSQGLDRRSVTGAGYGTRMLRWGAMDREGSDIATGGEIVREALRAAPNLVLAGGPSFEDPLSRYTWDEFSHQPSSNVVQTIAKAGGSGVLGVAAPWSYTVYEGQVVRFVARIAPSLRGTEPDYRLPYDPEAMADLQVDTSEIVDAVRARFRVDGVDRVTRWHYRDGMSAATATYRQTLSASFDSESAALGFLTTYLAQHSLPRLSGSIRLSTDDLLTQPGGGLRPALLARASEWVEIEGVEGVILRTTVDLFAKRVQLLLGEPVSSSAQAAMHRALSAGNAVHGKVDPISGRPWRL